MLARGKIRIPLFDGWFLFNVYEEPEIGADISQEEWLPSSWKLEKDSEYAGPRNDAHALHELARLLKFESCPFCRGKMERVLEQEQPGKLLVCTTCNYWGGRGTREWGTGPADHRGILGRYRFITDPEKVPADLLLLHLKKFPTDLLKLAPPTAERFIIDLVRDAFECDARLIGGVKDSGIDGVIVSNDKVRTIIQIKWHESSQKAESVSVVREVAGTLLAHGIPHGMIISTRSHYSRDARKEAEKISQREVVGFGES